jgi:putative spermidine/putrescine transport system substrate-binding protein
MTLNRRSVLKAAAGACIAPGLVALSSRGGFAQARRPLTFCSWGGALSELEKTAFLDPFAKAKGIEVVHASPTAYAKLKAMVEGGSPEWDLVDVGGRFIFQGADLLEPLDMALIPNAKNLDPGWVTPKGVFTSTGATVVAWNTKAFPADKGPASWKDFWDVKTFPGPRGSTSPSTTTTRRRCSPPARPAPRSIRSRKTR